MLYKEIELVLFERTIAGDEKAGQELAGVYWDKYFLKKYGLLKIPVFQTTSGSQPDMSTRLTRPRDALAGDPDPQPSITSRLYIYDYILSGLINFAAGDPDPEPNLVGLLIDPRVRLASAKQLIPKLNKAIDGISKEIEALEKSLGNQ